jgi:hypothetical protein
MRGAERFLAQHEDLGEERVRVVARRSAPTELDEEQRERRVVLRSELLREDPAALQHALSFGRVVLQQDLGLLRQEGKRPWIVSTVRIGDDPLRLPEQSDGFRVSPVAMLEVREELEPARAQHGLGFGDLEEGLDECARRAAVVPLERSRGVDHDQVPAPRMLGGKRGLDRLATRPDQIVVLDP